METPSRLLPSGRSPGRLSSSLEEVIQAFWWLGKGQLPSWEESCF